MDIPSGTMHAFIPPGHTALPLRTSSTQRSQPLSPLRRPRYYSLRNYVATSRACVSASSQSSSSPAPSPPLASSSTRPCIDLVACDVDGTLLTDSKEIAAPNVPAIIRLLRETQTLFVPATGKSRPGAVRSLGPDVEALLSERHPGGIPGVFLQGLLVFGLDGSVVFENACDISLVESSIAIANEQALDLIAYSRDEILCETTTSHIATLPSYHEPAAIEVGSWVSVISKRPINKLIFMADPSRINEVRPYLEKKLGHVANLTQAQPDMLEVLPPNASKGNGVRHFLEKISVDPQNVLAIGDAENDIELLSMVGFSCAVGNALPSVKAVAKYTDFKTNSEGAVADVLERFILQPPVNDA